MGGAQAVSLTWSVPGGVTRVVVTQKPGAVPTAPGDGTVVYDGTGEVGGETVTGLPAGQSFGYAAWTYDVDGAEGDPGHRPGDADERVASAADLHGVARRSTAARALVRC